MEFAHKSVLLQECIEGLAIKPDGIYLDGTLGGAGHLRGSADGQRRDGAAGEARHQVGNRGAGQAPGSGVSGDGGGADPDDDLRVSSKLFDWFDGG